jgi:hypothetical protein
MQQEKKYPIGGFAPGNYQCHCATCGGGFIGDKRAYQCEPCALNDRRKFDALSSEEQYELVKRNAKIANVMFSTPLSPERNLILRIVEQWGNAVCPMTVMEQWLKDYAATARITSQLMADYKQYKENLKFLGGPTEWTEEKVNNLSKVEVFEAIKGFSELINFLDNVLYAYEEGAQDWEERCLKAEAQLAVASPVWVSGDYDRLYDRLHTDPEKRIVCYVDYTGFSRTDGGPPCRDICTIKGKRLEFTARGIGYGGAWLDEGDKKEAFLQDCVRLNVEWLDETPNEQPDAYQTIQNIQLDDIDAPVFTHSPQFRDHFDYIKKKFLEIIAKANEQPVEQKENDAVAFAEWLRTFDALDKQNGQWVLESQLSSQQLYDQFKKTE